MTRAKEMRDLPLAIDVTASGNVGIGGTANEYSNYTTLTINHNTSGGILDIERNGNLVGELYTLSATDFGIQTGQATGAMRFRTNAGEVLTLLHTGNVGIGTASPDDVLEIQGSTNNTSRQVKIVDSSNATATHIGQLNNISYFTNNTYYNGSAWVRDDAAVGSSFLGLDNGAVLFGANTTATPNERMRVSSDGKVGIGTTSPLRNISVIGSDTSSSGYKDIAEFLEPNTTGGTVSVNFGVANSLNNLGKVDFTYVGAGSTDNWVSIGFHSNDNKLKVYANGLVEVASYLKSKKGTIQTVINQPTIYASANPVNTWAEVSSSYRIDITPRFSSGTKILGTYSVPMNPTGASNILMAIQPWYSTDGGTTKTLLNQGGPAGNRLTGSHAWFRSSNGYDGNDMQNHVVHFGYTHSATTTLTWGFYFRSEGSNTTYFCYSNGNSGSWGWTAPVYMELREVEVA